MNTDTMPYNPLDGVQTTDEAHAEALPTEVWSDKPDHDEAVKTARDAQLMSGTYTTVPALKMSKKKYDDGRRVALLFGQVLGTGKNNEGVEGRIMFRVSPDRRNREDGKPDGASKLWAHAMLAFKRVYEAEPDSIDAVLDYLQNYPIRIRGFAGTTDFIVSDLAEVKG